VRRKFHVEHGVQLDRVWRDAGLSVLEIEKGDTDDARVRAEAQLLPSSPGHDHAKRTLRVMAETAARA
jgi:hypothetical protein